MRVSRQKVRAIATVGPADERSVRKVLARQPVREDVRDRILVAIAYLGFTDLLGAEFTDPDAAKDLGR